MRFTPLRAAGSLVPRPYPVFQCCTQRATLKNWVGPGDEARPQARGGVRSVETEPGV